MSLTHRMRFPGVTAPPSPPVAVSSPGPLIERVHRVKVSPKPEVVPIALNTAEKLFELGKWIDDRISKSATSTHRLRGDYMPDAIVVKLQLREGGESDWKDSGCYISVTKVAGRRRPLCLKVLFNVMSRGYFADVLARNSGIVELHELARGLHDMVRGYEYDS